MARAGPRPRPGRQAHRAERRHDAGLRRPAGQAFGSDAGGGVRLGLERDRERSSTQRACASLRTRSVRWPGSTRSITPPTSRSTCGPIDADVLICSPYKFCGPHLGIAYGRAEVLETWRPYKARPAPMDPLGRRFATGTAPYELLAGLNATFDYLESIGGFEAISALRARARRAFLGGHTPTRSPCTACRRWRAGCPPFWSTSTVSPRPRSRASWPSARSACGRTTPGTR